MSNSLNENTDFSNVVITNDYPCLVGGNWTAYLDVKTGKTMYSQGTKVYEGPVNIIGANLTIQSGAVVDGIVVVPGSGNNNPTVTVQNGGTLKNSDIFNGYTNVQAGGTSQHNNYVSETVTLSSNSISTDDYFYNPISTSGASGRLNLSKLPSGVSTSFRTSDGIGDIAFNGGSKNVTVNNPHVIGNPSSSSYSSISFGNNCSFGSTALASKYANYDFDTNYGFTLKNDYPVYKGGNWTATLGADGKTYYSNGTLKNILGPLNLLNIGRLTIGVGAVVDNITVTGSTAPTIYNQGTIKNSFVSNSYLDNQSGSLSQNNVLISDVYYARKGSVSKNDFFYEGGAYVYGNYQLSQDPSLKSFLMSDNTSNVYLYAGSTTDGTYFGTGPKGSISIYPYYASNVSCFLPNSMIEMADGYKQIEEIKVGDTVVTYHNDQKHIRSIVWVGHNSVKANISLSEDEANYPIRIVKNAIAENVPDKDLLVTSEHCLWFEGKFVPARMLVNGMTIIYDHDITQYIYYHIETEDHSVINANGILTESYLDTGNRSEFVYNNNITSILNRYKQWNKDSAAPLENSRDVVEPLFFQLVERAKHMGFQYDFAKKEMTSDYGLQILSDDGTILELAYHNKGYFIFKLPKHITSIRLLSNVSRPSRVIGPFVDDRRYLGVLVGEITLLENNKAYNVTEHFTTSILPGWNVVERSPCRWTNGDAVVQIREKASNHSAMLVVQILAGGPYFVEEIHQESLAIG